MLQSPGFLSGHSFQTLASYEEMVFPHCRKEWCVCGLELSGFVFMQESKCQDLRNTAEPGEVSFALICNKENVILFPSSILSG